MHPFAWTRFLLLPALVALPQVSLTQTSTAESYQSWPPTQWKYGNWGGGNYSNGEVDGDVWGDVLPVDKLDEVFRRHDQNYAQADRDHEADYRKHFRSAALAYVRKSRVVIDVMVRGEARKDRQVKATWAKWLGKYAAADEKAHGEARWLTVYPSGMDPQTKVVEAKHLIRWAAFTGKETLSESQRMHKRLQFLRAKEWGLLKDPDREAVEKRVLDEILSAKR